MSEGGTFAKARIAVMSSLVVPRKRGTLSALVEGAYAAVAMLGDLAFFVVQALVWGVTRRPYRGTLLPACYVVGYRSVPVMAVTGAFIGMVLAVQAFNTFHDLGLATRLGSLINSSIVRELGPALAAVMLAGRVGSAMAAELATMRITEQIDAISCLGVNPIHYLVVPRFLACVLLIPLLTILANFTGVMGGAWICIGLYQIDPHHYWSHANDMVGAWDLTVGLLKPVTFGAAIALISCYRGFNSRPGAEGVGRAATEAFVASFIAILALDLLLAIFLNNLHEYFWPTVTKIV
jgi:phospholipid/cholesterol/gamma-HCH transport system permease protein